LRIPEYSCGVAYIVVGIDVLKPDEEMLEWIDCLELLRYDFLEGIVSHGQFADQY
jgi:hypothetical protein